MAFRSRIVASLACVLVALAAPAHAANSEAPGALKKQTTTPEQAAPAPTAPAAGAPVSHANPTAKTKSTAPVQTTAPATGVAKKVGQTRAQAAPSAGSTTAATHRVRRSTTRSHHAAPRPATPRASSTARRRALAKGRPHPARVRAHGTAGAPGQRVSSGAPGSAPGQSRSVSGSNTSRHAAAAKAKKKYSAAPLARISQAADDVIQVIPGAVILAIGALIALVLILILRSLMVERQRGKALATSYGVTVEALATAIEAKDLTTGGHIERVRRLGLLLANEIVPRETRDPQMAYGFLLHDIGKLAVPDAILRAPGRLSEEQWALMRRHPEEGVRMLAQVPFLDRALDVVRHHHERWDGGGYPDGLEGEEIPLWARIFAVVDALDAITAERPYRAPRSYEAALDEIRLNAGTQFDPAVVAALERMDPARIVPLLEPTQQVEPLAELPDPGPLVAV